MLSDCGQLGKLKSTELAQLSDTAGPAALTAIVFSKAACVQPYSDFTWARGDAEFDAFCLLLSLVCQWEWP